METKNMEQLLYILFTLVLCVNTGEACFEVQKTCEAAEWKTTECVLFTGRTLDLQCLRSHIKVTTTKIIKKNTNSHSCMKHKMHE